MGWRTQAASLCGDEALVGGEGGATYPESQCLVQWLDHWLWIQPAWAPGPSPTIEEPCDLEAGCFISLYLSFFISRTRIIIPLPVVKTEDANIRNDLEWFLAHNCT